MRKGCFSPRAPELSIHPYCRLRLWKSKWKSLSRVWLFATLWTIQSMEFSRPEYWGGEPFPSPGGSYQPRDRTQVSCIAGGFFTSWATRGSEKIIRLLLKLRFRSIKWRSYTWAFEKEKAKLLNCSGNSLWPYYSVWWIIQFGGPGWVTWKTADSPMPSLVRTQAQGLPSGFNHRVEADPVHFFHPGRKEFSFKAESTSGLGFV